MEDILKTVQDGIKFQPIDDRILVKPLKPIKVKKKVPVPVNPDAEVEPGKSPEMKIVTKSVDSNMSRGIVLKVGRTGSVTNIPFNEGDTVVFPSNAGTAFELFKDTILLKRYEILGIWTE